MKIKVIELLLKHPAASNLRENIIKELKLCRLKLTTSRSKEKEIRCWGHELAAELLQLIFSNLVDDVDTLCALRLACRGFERAVWTFYVKSFNNQIFHPTNNSLMALQDFADNEAAAPHLKQLRISTVKLVKVGPRSTERAYPHEYKRMWPAWSAEGLPSPNNAAQLQWLKESPARKALAWELRVALARLKALERIIVVDDDEIPFLREPKAIEIIEEEQESDATSLLWKAGQLMPLSVKFWLTLARLKIEKHPRNTFIKRAIADPAGWKRAAELDRERGWLFERKAHRHTLDIIYKAIQQPPPQQVSPRFLPNLHELKTQGRVNIASLWGCPYRVPDIRCCPRLLKITHLELRITKWHQKYDVEEMRKDVRYYLSDFLATMPNLTHLTLDFLPKWYSVSHEEVTTLTPLVLGYDVFGNAARRSIFRSLTHLHLRNITLGFPTALTMFLLTHSTTLRSLTMTNMRMYGEGWIDFYKFVGQNMALEEYVCIMERKSYKELKSALVEAREMPRRFVPEREDMDALSKVGIVWVERVVGEDGRLEEEFNFGSSLGWRE